MPLVRCATSSAARSARPRGEVVARVALAVAVSACLSACAGLLDPGAEPAPAPGAAPGVVGEAAAERRAPSAGPTPLPSTAPTSVGPIHGEHPQEPAAVDVRPAPSASPSGGAGPELPSDGAGGQGGGQDGAGPGGDSGGGAGGGTQDGAGDGGAQVDLTDAVQYAGALESAVNGRRVANGLPALVHDGCAYGVALERARALVGRELAHAPLDPIFETCPTTGVAENLAKGGWSPTEAAQGWMDSEGHRANILDGGLVRGAVACVADGGTPAVPVMICAHVFLA